MTVTVTSDRHEAIRKRFFLTVRKKKKENKRKEKKWAGEQNQFKPLLHLFVKGSSAQFGRTRTVFCAHSKERGARAKQRRRDNRYCIARGHFVRMKSKPIKQITRLELFVLRSKKKLNFDSSSCWKGEDKKIK
jgi:hypothetical protein